MAMATPTPEHEQAQYAACSYELNGAACGKSAVKHLREVATGKHLFLCLRHATSERLQYALAHGWEIVPSA